MIDPKELINYLGLGTGGGLLFWLAWKFVFRSGAEQTALATISGNFELMAKNLREQLEDQSAKIDELEAGMLKLSGEVKTLRKENHALKAENAKLREENQRLKYETLEV